VYGIIGGFFSANIGVALHIVIIQFI
jgi:hypothetical protein